MPEFNFFVPQTSGPSFPATPDIVGPSVAAAQALASGIASIGAGIATSLERKARRDKTVGAIDAIEDVVSDEGSYEDFSVIPATMGGAGKAFVEQAGGDLEKSRAGMLPSGVFASRQEAESFAREKASESYRLFDTGFNAYQAARGQAQARLGMADELRESEIADRKAIARADAEAEVQRFERTTPIRRAGFAEEMEQREALIGLEVRKRREELERTDYEAHAAYTFASGMLSSGDVRVSQYTMANARADFPGLVTMLESYARNPALEGSPRAEAIREVLDGQAPLRQALDPQLRAELIEEARRQSGASYGAAARAVDDAALTLGMAPTTAEAQSRVEKDLHALLEIGSGAASTMEYGASGGRSDGPVWTPKDIALMDEAEAATRDPEGARGRVERASGLGELLGEVGVSLTDVLGGYSGERGSNPPPGDVENLNVRIERQGDLYRIVPTRELDEAARERTTDFLDKLSRRDDVQGELRELVAERALNTREDLTTGQVNDLAPWLEALLKSTPNPSEPAGGPASAGDSARRPEDSFGFTLRREDL